MTTSNQDAAANLPKATRIFHPYAVKQIEEFSSRGYVRFVYYTSAETAFRILDTKRIWMRNVTCMSDYSEVQHGFNILNGILSKPENRRAFNEALDCCAPGCGEEAISAFNSWWADIRFNNYITCISEHDDSEDQHGRLSMWRAYGGSNARIAIVFKLLSTALYGDTFNLTISPVAYLTPAQVSEQFHQVLQNISDSCEFLRELGHDQIVRHVFNMFVSSVTCLKHEGFKEERSDGAVLGALTLLAGVAIMIACPACEG